MVRLPAGTRTGSRPKPLPTLPATGARGLGAKLCQKVLLACGRESRQEPLRAGPANAGWRSQLWALSQRWRPQGDSNPRYRRERAMSWASRRWGRRLNGGARRDRTVDLLHAMQALSQLSYGPTRGAATYGPVSGMSSKQKRLRHIVMNVLHGTCSPNFSVPSPPVSAAGDSL